MHRHLGLISLLLLVSTPRLALAVCTTPDDDSTYSLADLEAMCVDVTGASPAWAAADDIVVSPTDTLALGPGQSVEFAPGSALTVLGHLSVGALAADPTVLQPQAGNNWSGVTLAAGSSATIQGLLVTGAQTGLIANGQTSVSWRDVEIRDSVSDGLIFNGATGLVNLNRILAENNGGAGLRFSSCPASITVATFESTSNGVGVVFDGVGSGPRILNSNIHDNVGMGVRVDRGATGLLVNDTTISANGGTGIFADATTTIAADALRVQDTTVSGNTGPGVDLHGGASHRFLDVEVTDGLDAGLVWTGVSDAELKFSTVSRNGADGVRLDGPRAGYTATPEDEPFWLELGPTTADLWESTGDNTTLGPFGLPFVVEIDNGIYTQFVQHADGVVELLKDTQTPAGIDASAGWTTVPNSDRVLIFAQTDDWCADCDATFDPAGNFRGFGFGFLQEGESDGAGNKVEEDSFVLVWHMQSKDDVGKVTARNDFAVLIHPDGRVRWAVQDMNFAEAYQGVFNGMSLDSGETVAASRYARGPASWVFDPDAPGMIATPTTINGNKIRENAGAGISLLSGLRARIWDNAIGGNGVGLLHSSGSILTRLVFNNLDGNGPSPGTAEVENDQPEPLTARDNYWGIVEPASIDQAILDDEEDGSRGTVTYTPFRETPIQPGPPGVVSSFSMEPGDGAVHLSWNASEAPDAAGYVLHWGPNATDPANILELDVLTTETTLDGLSNGTRYFAYMTVRDLAGNVGEASAQVEAIPTEPPPPPGGGFKDIFGCGCRVTGSRNVPASTLWILLAAGLVLGWRRRSSTPQT